MDFSYRHRFLTAGCVAALSVLSWASTGSAQTTLAGGTIVDQTWTQAGSPYIIQGDLVVPSGSYLHIDAGVEVQVAAGDLEATAPDATRVAISILGALRVNGTVADPVHFHAQSGTSKETWHGIVIGAGATEAKLTGMVLEHAREGLSASNPLIEIYACTFRDNRFHGVQLSNGAAVFNRVLLSNMQNTGVRVNAGSVTMYNVIAIENGDHGFFLPGGNVTIFNSAAHNNNSNGLSCAGANIDIYNTQITNNQLFGVFQTAGQVDIANSNAFGNLSGSYSGAVTVVNAVDDDPEYVDGPSGDLSLQATSDCIDAGLTVGSPNNDYDNVLRPLDGDAAGGAQFDIGPYEYIPAPFCGDVQIIDPEVCDDGASNGTYGFCKVDCTGPGPFCGDNNTDAPFEECDDGNTTAGDGCDATCGDESMGSGGGGAGGSGMGGETSGSGGSGNAGAGGSDTADVCVPGEQVACACSGGVQGTQACAADGSAFGVCACPIGGSENDSGCGCTVVGSPERSAGAGLLLLLGAALFLKRRR